MIEEKHQSKKTVEEIKKDSDALKEQIKHKPSVYETLSKIDVKPYLKKKGNLQYLSWANALALVKLHYPKTKWYITEYPEYLHRKDGNWVPTGRTVDYRQTSAGIEVEATVKIESETYSSKLFVMDFKNKPIMKPNYFEINKTQLRALVKALANAGLGLSVYAGEDLPSVEDAKRAELANYPLDWEGKRVTLEQVLKGVRRGNSNAMKFANSFKGELKEKFDELSKLM